jgi:hypothetical protein
MRLEDRLVLDLGGAAEKPRSRRFTLAPHPDCRHVGVPRVKLCPGGMADGLPGLYQVGGGEGGVCVRGGCSGAGDGDERDGVGGDPVPVALER